MGLKLLDPANSKAKKKKKKKGNAVFFQNSKTEEYTTVLKYMKIKLSLLRIPKWKMTGSNKMCFKKTLEYHQITQNSSYSQLIKVIGFVFLFFSV